MIKMFENNISQLVRYVALMSVLVLATCTPNSELATVDNQPSSSSEQALALVAPELAGMDSSRLNRVTQAMQGFVDEGKLAGVVTMAARDNKIVHFESIGYRDLEAQAPMTNDALFRIYSMTKPVTGVALMILYEEGKFRLADPVEKYLPEFENLQVFAGTDDSGNIITEPQNHKMTIRELMSHTGGLSYGIFAQSPVDTKYVEADLLNNAFTLEEFTRRLGEIPLKHQPGSRWEYSVAVDVQGYLVEKLAGQPFGDFLQERIFDPLEMTDTDFYVPEEKVSRFAQVYGYNREGELEPGEGFPRCQFSGGP